VDDDRIVLNVPIVLCQLKAGGTKQSTCIFGDPLEFLPLFLAELF
jgi:hypothetical protein